MKKVLYTIIIAAVVALIAWVSVVFYNAYQPKPILLQGEIDAQSYNISSKLAGRIGKIFVKKGDMVKQGDKIFSIYSPELEAKQAQAKAAREAAGAKKNQAEKGARSQEIKAANDQWQKAKAAAELMQKTYTRIEKLYEEGVVSKQKRDEVYTKYKAAQYDANAAKELADMAKEGARKEVKQAATAQENVYKAKVEEVNAYVEEAMQKTIHNGEVSQVLIHEGELSPAGFPVVVIVDNDDAWARFAIREDYLPMFQMGKVFELKIPAMGSKTYRFKVAHIAAMGEYATWRATESGKGFDMKSFDVELRPVEKVSGFRAGMSALISIDAAR